MPLPLHIPCQVFLIYKKVNASYINPTILIDKQADINIVTTRTCIPGTFAVSCQMCLDSFNNLTLDYRE